MGHRLVVRWAYKIFHYPELSPFGDDSPFPVRENSEVVIEGSLEVKLPTIWTVEKQR